MSISPSTLNKYLTCSRNRGEDDSAAVKIANTVKEAMNEDPELDIDNYIYEQVEDYLFDYDTCVNGLDPDEFDLLSSKVRELVDADDDVVESCDLVSTGTKSGIPISTVTGAKETDVVSSDNKELNELLEDLQKIEHSFIDKYHDIMAKATDDFVADLKERLKIESAGHDMEIKEVIEAVDNLLTEFFNTYAGPNDVPRDSIDIFKYAITYAILNKFNSK